MQEQDLPYPEGVDPNEQAQEYGPDLANPTVGGQTISQDTSFMKQMFNFRKEVIDPLLHAWRGHEYDFERDRWYTPIIDGKPATFAVMNEKGIRYCITFMQSKISPVFTVSNFDEKNMNFAMRGAMKNLIQNLSLRYKEFGLKKTDILRVFWEIHNQTLAILLGARGDGYRQFFSKQYQVHESISNMQTPQQKSGLLSGISSIFKGQQQR